MIYKKDVGDGEVFWAAVTAERIILPNGAQYEQLTYKPTRWYLDREIARAKEQ